MNFLLKLFGFGATSDTKRNIKRTPEIQASLDRIEARKQKELKEFAEKQRRERLLKPHTPSARDVTRHPVSADEELRRLERRALQPHNDRLQADSGIMANSKMDMWMNTIAPEAPPDTIAPEMRIPDTVFNVETNKFGNS
ncbi:hypothetical protein [Undibacterium fentianense]|uniref:Uncharacterized protein n=1 Tax=Undibacterium fentianense TaxID=2828728 RepID=A0A941E4A9_9BURK|nr:hypothetical protein [Undibacterium fentianense]MBR7800771.1 hypothetical protein [Undibacterium fentianense]